MSRKHHRTLAPKTKRERTIEHQAYHAGAGDAVTGAVTEQEQDVFPQGLAAMLGLSFEEPKPMTAKQIKAEDAAFNLLKNSNRYMVGTVDAVDNAMEDAHSSGVQHGLKVGATLPRTVGELRVAQEKPALSNVLQEVFVEAQKAIKQHGPMHSPHEGLGVIMEEFDELKEEIYADRGKMLSARAEAIQLAAMAVRYVLNVNPR